MPYVIRTNDSGQHCVMKEGTGEVIHCHETRAQAVRQIAAMMIAEQKQRRAGMSAEFAGTRPAAKESGHKSAPKGYPASRDQYADPENWKYPLSTEEFARAALAYFSKAANRSEYSAAEQTFIWGRILAACRKFGIQVSASHSVEFDLDGETWEDDGMVYRAGLVFRAGDYPDKGFEITPEEMAEAAAEFQQPVDMELEHLVTQGKKTVLDGKLGQLVAVEPDGADLLGVVAVPKWLDATLPPDGRKVSAVWDVPTKRLKRMGWVTDPRVPDAALLSAFSEAFPQPADSRPADDGPTVVPGTDANPTQQQPARPAPAKAARQRKETRMDLNAVRDRIMAIFTTEEAGTTDSDPPEAPAAEAPRTEARMDARPDPILSAEIKALKEQIAAQTRRSDEERARRIEAEATGFAEQMVREGKAVPAENPALIALFAQAARDDDATPAEVTFGSDVEGKPLKGGRVATLRALFEARPQHVLMGEQIPAGAQVLLNRTETFTREKIDREEIEAELARTSLGRAALARKEGGK